MQVDAGLLIARLMLATVYLWSGFDKVLHWSAGLSEVEAGGLPFPTLLLLATVIVQILGGRSIVLGIWARLGALALAGFTAIATLLFHSFWTAADPVEHQRQLTAFLEHVAIVGGFVAITAAGPGRYSIDEHRSPATTRPIGTHA
ncbi:MAG: DoxX family protein [Acidimicrobiia bacterium]|nr:DoxX family protein [Acidimicrobiia bacterium]